MGDLTIIEESKQNQDKLTNDPAANIIEEYLLDDVSNDSFGKYDNSKKEKTKLGMEADKVDLIYKAINQNLERSRLANNRQFQTEDKHYNNSKITLNLETTHSKANDLSQSKISNPKFKYSKSRLFKF